MGEGGRDLIRHLFAVRQPRVIVEIGAFMGGSVRHVPPVLGRLSWREGITNTSAAQSKHRLRTDCKDWLQLQEAELTLPSANQKQRLATERKNHTRPASKSYNDRNLITKSDVGMNVL
jgi:hypothetical protein